MHRTRGALGVVAGRVACLKCCKVAGVGTYIALNPVVAPIPPPPPITDPMLSIIPLDPPDSTIGYSYSYDASPSFEGSVATYTLNNAPAGLAIDGLSGIISGKLGEIGTFPNMSVTAHGTDGPVTTAPVEMIVISSDGSLNAGVSTSTQQMFGNNNPAGVWVTFSSDPQIDQAFRAFDRNASIDWIASSGTNEWIAYEFTSPLLINKYIVQASQNNGAESAPHTWEFQASHDGISWVTLGSEAGEIFTTGGSKTYTVFGDDYYKHYKLNVIRDNTSANLRIGELTLIEGQLS